MQSWKFRAFVVLVALWSADVFSGRTLQFSQVYANRCPQDRVASLLIFRNISTVDQTVSLSGGVRVLAGDGGCGQSYASLGIYFDQVHSCRFYSTRGTATSLGSNQYRIGPGAEVQYYCGGLIGGGSGVIYGVVTVSEDKGAVIGSGVVTQVQDSASPNLTISTNFSINGARPF